VLALEAPPGELVDHSEIRAALTEQGLGGRRLFIICRPSTAALVLGSTQSFEEADEERCAALGAALVRRRSGGGGVFVAPRAQAWADAFLPTGDPLLDPDVGRSFGWFGTAWAAAIVSCGAATEAELSVAEPSRERDRWAHRLCFSALGSGEVTVSGRKVVGISQRRDRAGAWLHSMAPLRDTTRELIDCLALSEDERAEASGLLAARSSIVPATEQALSRALLAALPH
jgi:lipoate-protein ligase A